MNHFLTETIGWAGAIAILGSYGLLSVKKIKSDSYTYQNANIIGGGLLTIYSFAKSAFASMFVNFIWVFIGLYAVYAIRKSQKPPRELEAPPNA